MATSYEEQWGPFGRRWRRLIRRLRWWGKTAFRGRLRILVELRWRLGDEIMAIPVYDALRQKFPRAHITVWCTYPELLTNNPFVDAVNDPDPDPDRYINLRSGPRFTNRLAHYAALAGVPVPALGPRLYYTDWATPLLDRIPEGDGPVIAIATGSTWPTKHWPQANWKVLCKLLSEEGFRVIQLGKDCETIACAASFIDETSVGEAACVLRAARMLVTSDSGIMHLALAAQTPVLALFGPTLPEILVTNEPLLHVITNDRDCQGCWNRADVAMREGECPLHIECCLGTITPDLVFARVQDALKEEH